MVGSLWGMLGDVIVISKQWMIHGFLALGRNDGSLERECLDSCSNIGILTGVSCLHQVVQMLYF